MASTIHMTQHTAERVDTSTPNEVVFVPTFVDWQTPVKRAARALQWRRQLSDFVAGVINGATSL